MAAPCSITADPVNDPAWHLEEDALQDAADVLYLNAAGPMAAPLPEGRGTNQYARLEAVLSVSIKTYLASASSSPSS